MINKDILEKFRKLYKEKYDIDLTDEQTTQLANDLVNIMRVLLRPDPKKPTAEIEEGSKDENLRAIQL